MTVETALTIKVTMAERWVPQFLGMLREMERLGDMGSSRTLAFYAYGDGDFRPKFEWDSNVEPAEGVTLEESSPIDYSPDQYWDADDAITVLRRLGIPVKGDPS